MYGNLNQGFRFQFFPSFIVTDHETGGLKKIGKKPRHQLFKLDVLMGQHGAELCFFLLFHYGSSASHKVDKPLTGLFWPPYCNSYSENTKLYLCISVGRIFSKEAHTTYM
jgi:hypothetical protein